LTVVDNNKRPNVNHTASSYIPTKRLHISTVCSKLRRSERMWILRPSTGIGRTSVQLSNNIHIGICYATGKRDIYKHYCVSIYVTLPSPDVFVARARFLSL